MSIYPPDLAAYVAQKIAEGRFESPEEFAVVAARAYRDFERREAELRRELQLGLDEANQGFVAPLDVEALKREVQAMCDDTRR